MNIWKTREEKQGRINICDIKISDMSVFLNDTNGTLQNGTLFSNHTNSTTNEFQWERWSMCLVSISIVLLLVFALVGVLNIATINFTLQPTQRNRPFNVLIATMAAGDLLCSDGIVIMDFIDLTYLLQTDHIDPADQGVTWCTAKVLTGSISLNISLLTVTLIALLRMCQCCNLLPEACKAKQRIVTAVLVMAILLTVALSVIHVQPKSSYMDLCMGNLSVEVFSQQEIPIQGFVALTCVILTVFSYVMLYVYLWCNSAVSPIGNNDILTLRTGFIITAVFVISATSPVLLYLFKAPESMKGAGIFCTFIRTVCYTQSALNPLVYCQCSKLYRAHLKKLVKYQCAHPTAPQNVDEPVPQPENDPVPMQPIPKRHESAMSDNNTIIREPSEVEPCTRHVIVQNTQISDQSNGINPRDPNKDYFTTATGKVVARKKRFAFF